MAPVTLVRDVRDAMLHVALTVGADALCGVEAEHLSGYLFDQRRRANCTRCAVAAPPCRCPNCTSTTIPTTQDA